jgi:hypothetical protein
MGPRPSGEEAKHLPLPGIEPGRPVRRQITILTELPRMPGLLTSECPARSVVRGLVIRGWRGRLVGKLTVAQLVKKYPAFYGTRRFITAFTRARHWSLS